MDEGYIEINVGFSGFPFILSKKFLRLYERKKIRIRILKEFRKFKIRRKFFKKSFDEINFEYNDIVSKLEKLSKNNIISSTEFGELNLKWEAYYYIQRHNEKYEKLY